jgi:RHS repeat-associated protein
VGAASSNTNQYTGRENDGNGLYYMRARYYSPGLHRFTSEDPLGFEGGDTNLYSYVGGNPANYTDPLGLIGQLVAAGGLLVGGGEGLALGAAAAAAAPWVLAAGALLAAGYLAYTAYNAFHPGASCPVQMSGPKAPTLSEEEEKAIKDKEAGLPYDKDAYNRGRNKVKQGEKFKGERNKGKQRGGKVR